MLSSDVPDDDYRDTFLSGCFFSFIRLYSFSHCLSLSFSLSHAHNHTLVRSYIRLDAYKAHVYQHADAYTVVSYIFVLFPFPNFPIFLSFSLSFPLFLILILAIFSSPLPSVFFSREFAPTMMNTQSLSRSLSQRPLLTLNTSSSSTLPFARKKPLAVVPIGSRQTIKSIR